VEKKSKNERESMNVSLLTLHLEKRAIRVLGVAESFKKNQVSSTLAGIVMRSDLVVDGMAVGKLEISGSDSTRTAIALYTSLRRNDINGIMISGSVLSLYNVLDLDLIFEKLKIPVLALSFSKSSADLARNIRERFPEKVAEKKIRLLEKLGKSQRIGLKTGYDVFVRTAGINEKSSKTLLDKFTLQGSSPEPIRVARLLAKTIAPLQNS
jgi:endonuclease V-like protein UPF0215 family